VKAAKGGGTNGQGNPVQKVAPGNAPVHTEASFIFRPLHQISPVVATKAGENPVGGQERRADVRRDLYSFTCR
jgi:hypothetical protein